MGAGEGWVGVGGWMLTCAAGIWRRLGGCRLLVGTGTLCARWHKARPCFPR